MLTLAKISITEKTVWQDALSWFNTQLLLMFFSYELFFFKIFKEPVGKTVD